MQLTTLLTLAAGVSATLLHRSGSSSSSRSGIWLLAGGLGTVCLNQLRNHFRRLDSSLYNVGVAGDDSGSARAIVVNAAAPTCLLLGCLFAENSRGSTIADLDPGACTLCPLLAFACVQNHTLIKLINPWCSCLVLNRMAVVDCNSRKVPQLIRDEITRQ